MSRVYDPSAGRYRARFAYARLESSLLTPSGRQVFLLLGDFDRARWQKLLADSRSAYTSLNEHFLRSINHPEAVDSTVDPLTDDDDVRTVVMSCFETYVVDLGLNIMSD